MGNYVRSHWYFLVYGSLQFGEFVLSKNHNGINLSQPYFFICMVNFNCTGAVKFMISIIANHVIYMQPVSAH